MALFQSPNLVSYPGSHPLLPFKSTTLDPMFFVEPHPTSLKHFVIHFQTATEMGLPFDVLSDVMGDIRQIHPQGVLDNRTWVYPLKQLAELQMYFDILELDNYSMHKDVIENYLKTYAQSGVKSIRIPVDDQVFPASITPYKAQQSGVRWMIPRNRFCNNDDTGMGKTMQTIVTVSEWYKRKVIDSIVVVVKESLVYQWKEEFLKFSTQFKEEDFLLVYWDNKEGFLEQALQGDKKIIIIAMRALPKAVHYYRGWTPKRKKYKDPRSLKTIRWTEDMIDIKSNWKKTSPVLIVDEVHNFNRLSSSRTQALLAMRNQFTHRITLSATLSMTAVEGYYPLFKVLDDSLVPMTERAFSIFIAKKMGNNWSPWVITEYDEEVVKLCETEFKKHTIKRLKKDQPDMKAEQSIVPRKLLLDEDRAEIYRILLEEEVSQLKNDYRGVPSLVMRKALVLTRTCLDNAEMLKGKIHPSNKKLHKLVERWHLGKCPKLAYASERLEDLIKGQNKKVIIFDHHPETLNYLYEEFQDYKPLIVHGQLKDRTQEQDELKKKLFNDPNSPHKLFLLSSIIGAEGWNLQGACHNVIVYTCPTSTKLRQLVDRTHRIVSVDDTVIEILVFAKTYDDFRYERARARMELNDTFLSKEETITLAELQELFTGAYSTEQRIQRP